MYCRSCGLYFEDHLRDLKFDCKGFSARGSLNIKNIRAGKHPAERDVFLTKPIRICSLQELKRASSFLTAGVVPDSEDEAELHGVAGPELGDVGFEFPEDVDAVLAAPDACNVPLPMDDPSQRGLD